MRGEPCSDSSDADDEDDEERESGERESGERKSGERVATFRAARGLIPTPLTNANVPPLTQPIPGSGFFDLDSAVDQRTIGYEDYTSSSVGDLSDFAESIATSIHGSRNGSTIDGNDPIDDLERELDTLIQDVWMQLEKATSMYERLSTVDDPTVAELHAVLRTFWSVTNDAAAYRRAFADIPGCCLVRATMMAEGSLMFGNRLFRSKKTPAVGFCRIWISGTILALIFVWISF